jgi:rhamnose transport system substrate-binding protein
VRNKPISTVLAVGCAAALALTACTTRNDTGGSGGGTGGNDDEVSVAFVPKLQGIPYFEAMDTGGKKAAEELGFKWLYQGATTADAAAQAEVVRSFIQQDVDVIFAAPNDPDSIAPVLKEAENAGLTVATTDTDAPNSVRDIFVSQASPEGIAHALTDQLMKAMDGDGKYAIVSCGETAANLNTWIEIQKEYTSKKYPDAEIVDIVYAGEDQAKATQMATNLMNAHPDLEGLVGECTSSAPGVAQAVADANRIGEVFTVGLGTPQAMKPYLESGAATASVLWDVVDLGYLTGWAGVQLAKGKEIPAEPKIEGIPDVTFDAETNILLLGPPLIITEENVDNFNY